ncbi:Protein of unknown function DUF2087 [Solidesulfovibrio carbinoliphilus subsp. oakridgensis]|uniref:DUF2087 domain-containing protein n=1 Tax=Solidesulfovibrio carbinoliphilus subsp. oakridgensis TaxID=694327 RepID=G7Q416_9BACT|nr:DUF2087 domain-containing protein [Solidesulfovibrio carbinoliphilus]EHJ46806.1 Protein of unknown function DUF2087 [Solidesulfovibrio carbinoliphilus subsp. oakridgensis]
MSRESLPFCVDDISVLAKALRTRLLAGEAVPGHVELLNILARSAGCRNFQHFRAKAMARDRLAAPRTPADAVDLARVTAVARHFDAKGRLLRWPSKRNHQLLCLWALWAGIPPRQTFDERGITGHLQARHLFGDPALLRRELCDLGLLARTADCREYRRVEQRPPAEARALVRHLEQAGEETLRLLSA